MTARDSWRFTHWANRRWNNYTCHDCGGHCAAHHALYHVQGYSEHCVEYHCPCGAFTLYQTKDVETVGERGVW